MHSSSNKTIPSNLVLNWAEDKPDGPDPEKLSGLLELGERYLTERREPSELRPHFEAMKNKVVQLHVERSSQFKRLRLDSLSAEHIGTSLSDLENIELGLEGFLEACARRETEACWETLGELEAAMESLKESSLMLENFLHNSPLICTGCRSVGTDHVCADCGAERLQLDPAPGALPEYEDGVSVPQPVLEVFHSYESVLNGTASLHQLCDKLELVHEISSRRMAEAESLLLHLHPSSERGRRAEKLLTACRGVMEGLEEMGEVIESRTAKALRTGWLKILEYGVEEESLSLGLQPPK